MPTYQFEAMDHTGQEIKDIVVEAWAGLFAPKGTPEEIVNRLNAEANRILAIKEVK